MNKNDVFPSKYLAAADLPDEGIVLTIESVGLEKLQDGEMKPVMTFAEKRFTDGAPLKPMLVNVTKWNTIARLYGDESNDWTGKRVSLRPGEVKFKGEMVACIDVSSRKPGEPKAANGKRPPAKGTPVAEAAIAAAQEDADDDFDTPF